MTTFAALLTASGLSQQEAGAFLGIDDPAIIAGWMTATGYREPPPAVRSKMLTLVRQIAGAIDRAVWAETAQGQRYDPYEPPASFTIACSRTDEEARAHGWASLSHELAAVGMVLAVVPRAVVQMRSHLSADFDMRCEND